MLVTTSSGFRAFAGDETSQCRAVKKLASIKYSSKLLVNLAQDEAEMYCHYVVSMPPPFSVNNAAEAWYNKNLNQITNEKIVIELLFDIISSSSPKGAEKYMNDIKNHLEKNSPTIKQCIDGLIKKSPMERKSPDGRVRCEVSRSAEQMIVAVSPSGNFSTITYLPRLS